MNETTPTPILPLTWKSHASHDVDGLKVRASGPVVTTHDQGYPQALPTAGSLMIHEDRGSWGPCKLDQWKDGPSHGLIRGNADGTFDYLGTFSTWKAAQFAGAAVVAGYDLTNADDLAEVRRQYRAAEHAVRMKRFDKKHGLITVR